MPDHAASHPCTFCRAVARGSYFRNSCSKCHKIKAAVEALARIVYKPTKSASSIRPIKLAKREVTPFHSIKLTCASESEVQTLKATVSQHEEDSNRELFPVPCLEVRFFFTYRIAVCSVRCIYLEKNSLLRSSACTEESTFQTRPCSEQHRSSYAVGIQGTNPQRYCSNRKVLHCEYN